MVEKLAKLYNTLSIISTKGEDTKLMAQCLQFIENMIAEEQVKEKNNEKSDVATE